MLTHAPSARIPVSTFVAPGIQNDPAQHAAPPEKNAETTDRSNSAVTGLVARNQNPLGNQNPLNRGRRNAPATGPIFKLNAAQKTDLKEEVLKLEANIKNLKSSIARLSAGKRPHVLGTVAIMFYWMNSPGKIVADIIKELAEPHPKTVYIRLLLEDLKDLMERAKLQIPKDISLNFGDVPADVSERQGLIELLDTCVQTSIDTINPEISKYPSQLDYLHSDTESEKHGPVIKSDTFFHIKPKAVSPVKTTLKLDEEEEGFQLEGQDNPIEVAPEETHRWTRTQTNCTNYVVQSTRDNKVRKFSLTNEFKPVARTEFDADAAKVAIPGTGTTSTVAKLPDQMTEYSISVPQRREIKMSPNDLIHTQDSELEPVIHGPGDQT